MNRSRGPLIVLLLASVLQPACSQKLLPPTEPTAAVAMADQSGKAQQLHRQTAQAFRARPDAGARIDFTRIDYVLLDAAVFHETNRVRAKHGLAALTFEPRLREAARIQAEGVRQQQKLSHFNPQPGKRTLTDRLKFAGFPWTSAAENLAMTFGVRYQPGTQFYPRQSAGGTILSLQPNGPPIPPHSYLSFAESLLGQWMNSPKHRTNILSRSPTHLGTSSLHSRPTDSMDRFYSAQVFGAPS